MSKRSGPRTAGAFVPSVLLNRLGGRLDETDRLRATWARCLPEALARHTCPVRYESGCLFINADSGAWATRVRHSQTELIARLRGERGFEGLSTVMVRVRPVQAPPTPPSRRAGRRPRLSTTASDLLTHIAEDVSDPELRAALKRLGATHASSKRGR